MYKRGNLYGNPTCLRREPLDIPPVYRRNDPTSIQREPTLIQGEHIPPFRGRKEIPQ